MMNKKKLLEVEMDMEQNLLIYTQKVSILNVAIRLERSLYQFNGKTICPLKRIQSLKTNIKVVIMSKSDLFLIIKDSS
jgi:hypothetical protein